EDHATDQPRPQPEEAQHRDRQWHRLAGPLAITDHAGGQLEADTRKQGPDEEGAHGLAQPRMLRGGKARHGPQTAIAGGASPELGGGGVGGGRAVGRTVRRSWQDQPWGGRKRPAWVAHRALWCPPVSESASSSQTR